MKKIYFKSENAIVNLSNYIFESIKYYNKLPAIICLGTNRIINDSLGPLVGTLLKQKYNCLAYVYGTINAPITAFKSRAIYDFVSRMHEGSPVIIIDASIGNIEEHGIIKITETEKTFFLNKQIPMRTELCITAVTGFNIYEFVLQKTKTDFVGQIADIIAYSFNNALFLKSLKAELLI
ncbi:MAG: DUF1256 domain-containing protein [Clostridia bacterium]|jgi:putative sporulation protein YyaC|nr:spore protease YyaC [Clostridia bacterium]